MGCLRNVVAGVWCRRDGRDGCERARPKRGKALRLADIAVDISDIGLFLGLDLGKEFHHAHGLTEQGKTVHDKRLPNTEARLRELFDKLRGKFGTGLSIAATGKRGGFAPWRAGPVGARSSCPWSSCLIH